VLPLDIYSYQSVLYVLERVSNVCMIFGVLFIVFQFFIATPDDTISKWLSKISNYIMNERLLILFKKGVEWFIGIRQLLTKIILRMLSRLSLLYLIAYPIIFSIGCYIIFRNIVYVFASFLLAILFPLFAKKRAEWLPKLFHFLGRSINTLTIILFIYFWIKIIFDLNIRFSWLLVLLMLPLLTYVLLPLVQTFRVILIDPILMIWILFKGSMPDDNRILINVVLLSFYIPLSIFVTFLALYIGWTGTPNAYLPKTFQMIASNLVFDCLTILTTFFLVEKLMRGLLFLRTIVVILLDTFLSAIYACLSLYCGLYNTDYALNFEQSLNVLLAIHPDGTKYFFGPYFWVMHTAFIPTSLFLFLILTILFAKSTYSFFNFSFSWLASWKRPFYYVTSFFVLFGFFSGYVFPWCINKLLGL